MFKLTRWALSALALIALQAYSPAFGQTYPSRPITIVVPLAAGTGMDVIARMYGEKLSQSLGKPVIIENKPGASLMLAAVAVANAPADGHTLLISTSSAMSINPTLFKKINYDPEKDFAPVSWYLKSPFILVVNPALPIRSVPDLIKYAKASATPLTYSSPGPGVAQHLSIEFMKQRFGVDMNHIPYRSTPQSMVDISTGVVHLAFAEAGASLPLIKDGRLRARKIGRDYRVRGRDLVGEPEPFDWSKAKLLTPESRFFELEGTGDDDATDVSANKHKYLADIYYEESHPKS